MTLRIITDKFFLAESILVGLVALACTQVPLLNYLGFEYSLLIAVLTSFLCGLLAISRWRMKPPLSLPEFWEYFRQTFVAASVIIAIPLVVMTVNAFFVKNCSITQGVRLYVLYVVPSVFYGISLAVLSSALAWKYKKILFCVLFAVVLFHAVYRTMTGPQIFVFNPILGYFPGFSYDETFQGEVRLFVYRVGTLALGVLLLLIAVLIHRIRVRTLDGARFAFSLVPVFAAIIFSLTIYMGLNSMRNAIGLASSTESVMKELGGVQRTTHFLIIYPKKFVNTGRLKQIVILHEYFFDQLRREFQVNPRKPITTFLYESANQKMRLVGAGNTDFTKPWLRQIHLNLEDVDGLLKHELTHAMLAEEGVPVLQIAPNSGLIEGAAVAAEHVEYEEELDRLSAAIFALGINIDVSQMFTVSGFFKSYPAVSYVLAGSFCRYLLDQYGVARFKALYRTGEFGQWYKKDLASLIQEWRGVVRSIELNQTDLKKAAYLFRRSPIYLKECARVIANINAQTRDLLKRKDYLGALQSVDWSLSQSRSTEAVFQKTNVLFRLGRYDTAIEFAKTQLEDSTIKSSLLPLRFTLGDSYWVMRDFAKATEQYSEILSTNISLSMNETAALRLAILEDTTARSSLGPYFFSGMADSVRTAYLDSLKDYDVSPQLAGYLLAREFSAKENSAGVVEELRGLPVMKSQTLQYVKERRIARAYFDLGEIERSKMHYWQALNFAPNEAHLYQIEDFLQRCIWIETRVR